MLNDSQNTPRILPSAQHLGNANYIGVIPCAQNFLSTLSWSPWPAGPSLLVMNEPSAWSADRLLSDRNMEFGLQKMLTIFQKVCFVLWKLLYHGGSASGRLMEPANLQMTVMISQYATFFPLHRYILETSAHKLARRPSDDAQEYERKTDRDTGNTGIFRVFDSF